MNALIETSGRQFWVTPGDRIEVDRMDCEIGAEVPAHRFRVLMIKPDSDADPRIGTPEVEGATVKARVVEHTRGPKVVAFKYKRRKRYRRRRGFRASLTTLEITDLDLSGLEA